ncbi:MAG: Isocitrate dehydrogenase kinase/phosphatase [Candidatus Eisenbacteria bacterium]|jgi:isocitrate dehydrogenase kinase/phosphatase
MAPETLAPWDEAGANVLLHAFEGYRERFAGITARARRHFERRDGLAAQRDSARRLDLYGESVLEALTGLRERLGALAHDRDTWVTIRDAYARRVSGRGDTELAETFFNSCARRTFATVGVDPGLEFVAIRMSSVPGAVPEGLTTVWPRQDRLAGLVRRVLEDQAFDLPFDDLEGDARRAAAAIVDEADVRRIRALELARPVFYRGQGAYLVGRLLTDGTAMPFLIGLRNAHGRLVLDAVLTSEDEVSVVFSFTRSYFMVAHERPRELVDYLRLIMPRKPIAELYNAIGHHRHGKTELYRSLLHHLATTDDRFTIAPGTRGMVMCVFTLPGFDVVFKVIRDRFDPPKTVTHEEVRAKYRLVFRHDRAGRLADAQEFEHLTFARERFEPELLEMLLRLAGETVEVRGDTVIVHHLYTERRLRPLDLYLREASPLAAREAVLDYGQALRDLAATNIFPGDMLLKNFGVSRHGRLIFYDYDELAALTECRFRELPAARADGEDTAGEPWYYVGERDIFPEEFRTFLGLRGDLLAAFLAHHEELLGVAWWHRMQATHERNEVLDVAPYRASRRLRRGAADPDARPEPPHPRSPSR